MQEKVQTQLNKKFVYDLVNDWFELRKHIFKDPTIKVQAESRMVKVTIEFGMDDFSWNFYPMGYEYLATDMVREVLTAMLQKTVFDYIRKGMDL